MQAAALSTLPGKIRYDKQGTYTWLCKHAPCFWNDHVVLQFTDLPLSSLKPSGCWICAGHRGKAPEHSAEPTPHRSPGRL